MNIPRASLCVMAVVCCSGTALAQLSPMQELRRGFENALRSVDDSNSRRSSPGVERQREISMSYDNEIKRLQTLHTRKTMAREFREAEERRKQARRDAARHPPERLSATQLDPYRGTIRWPAPFTLSAYSKDRTAIDNLYPQHVAEGGGVGTSQYADIYKHIRELNRTLSRNSRNVPAPQYSNARKFLEGLSNEAKAFGS